MGNNNADVMKRALKEIRELREELKVLKNARHEPIAVIGMACRFPGGVDSPESLWRSLAAGENPLSEIPAQRWSHADYFSEDNALGKTNVNQGCFIQDVEQFDAAFFHISDREAEQLDPQQRLILELGWEALQSAALLPKSLRNSATGVFIGAMTQEYSSLIKNAGQIDLHTGTGNAPSIIAGRLAYYLGLRGPAMTIDTACSSSLAAVHLAIQAIRQGECDSAFAGGVHLQLSPKAYVVESQAHMLSADGRCKTFDDQADGIGRGEGAGLILLKRLSAAERDGDPIIAVLRGTAMNHDGRSSGLTVPSEQAQEQVIQTALDNARLAPEQLNYVEAHGTGTPLGDPIEVNALASVYGKNRDYNNPIYLGSIKTNFGHMEGAAGIGGLMKLLLMLQRGQWVPHLHLKTPNHLIDWQQLPVKVVTNQQAWPPADGCLRVGAVSAFGLSGTNVHLIAENYAAHETADIIKPSLSRGPWLFKASAQTEAALAAYLARYGEWLDRPETGGGQANLFINGLYSNNIGMADFDWRFACVAENPAQLREAINVAINPHPNLPPERGKEIKMIKEITAGQKPRIVFLFTGQGSQYPDMAKGLYDRFPAFAHWLNRADEMLRQAFDLPLLDVLYGASQSLIHETRYTQPALYAIEYGLCQLWREWGVEPDCVLGHSVGEYAAAAVAGVFSFEQGLRLIATRARLMQSLDTPGAMLAVELDESEVAELIEPYGDQVSLAAVNGAKNCVIAGNLSAIEAIQQAVPNTIRTNRLEVSHAFHSPLMEPILTEFAEAMAAIVDEAPLLPPRITLLSNLSGQPAGDEITSIEYWVQHIRQPVRFYQSLQNLFGGKETENLLIECGPKPVLLSLAQQARSDIEESDVVKRGAGEDAGKSRYHFLPSLRQPTGRDAHQQPLVSPDHLLPMLSAAAKIYELGIDLNGAALWPEPPARRIALPAYPFQRRAYWLPHAVEAVEESVENNDALPLVSPEHPLVHGVFDSPALAVGERLYLSRHLLRHAPYLKDHQVYDTAILPAAAYAEMALFIAQARLTQGNQSQSVVISDFQVLQPLPLNSSNRAVQCVSRQAGEGGIDVSIYSRPAQANAQSWTQHSSCRIKLQSPAATPSSTENFRFKFKDEIPGQALDVARFYQRFADNGIVYGEAFQGIQRLYFQPDETIAQIKLPSRVVAAPAKGVMIHPVLLDCCIQLAGASAILHSDEPNQPLPLYLPARFEKLQLFSPELCSQAFGQSLWGRLFAPRHDDAQSMTVNIQVSDDQGRLLFQIEGLRYQKIEPSQFKKRLQQLAQPAQSQTFDVPLADCFTLEWQPTQLPAVQTSAHASKTWLLISPEATMPVQQFADAIKQQLNSDACIIHCAGKTVEDLTRLITEAAQKHFQPTIQSIIQSTIEVIYFAANTTAEAPIEHTYQQCESLLALVQALGRASWQQPPALTLVTQNAQAVTLEDRIDPSQSAAWAMARTIAIEYPEWQLVQFDRGIELESAWQPALLNALQSRHQSGAWENQLAYRLGRVFVPHYQPIAESQSPAHAPSFNPERTYLITGGLGAIGFALCAWLIGQGARHLVLTGRQAGHPQSIPVSQAERIAAWREQGIVLETLSCDIADYASVAELIQVIRQTLPPLDGVFHAAGLLDDGLLNNLTPQRLHAVLRPKVNGTVHLDQLTRDLSLSYFVCFSSAAALLGAAGQANYAAANGWMDGLMHSRKRQGLAATTMNYGYWRTDFEADAQGMAEQSSNDLMTAIDHQRGFNILSEVLARPLTQVAVFTFQWQSEAVQQLQDTVADSALRRLLSLKGAEGVKGSNASGSKQSLSAQSLSAQLSHLSSSKRAEFISDYTQKLLARTLRQTLNQQQLGISLINLGMDSLIAMEIRQAIHRELAVEIPIAELLEGLSCQALQQRIERACEATLPANGNHDAPHDDTRYPLTHGQRSLWFIQQLNPKSSAYHLAFSASVLSTVDVAALEQSFAVLQQRHPALQTAFELQQEQPMQYASLHRAVDFVQIDCESQTDDAIDQTVMRHYQAPFDLLAGKPLWRVRLFSRSASEHILLLAVHHIVFDAWSLWLLLEELQQLYAEATSSSVGPTETKSDCASYRDYVSHQQAWLASETAEIQWQYWRNQLSGDLPVLSLAEDYPRPAVQDFSGKTLTLAYDSGLLNRLKQSAQRQGVTLYTLLLACYQLLLHRFSGQEDLVIGAPVNGRTETRFAQTLGYFVNPVAIRSNYQPAQSWPAFLAETRQAVIDGIRHQDFPFALLIERLHLARDPSRSPVFQASFVFQQLQASQALLALGAECGDQKTQVNFAGLQLAPYQLNQQEGQFDLTLELQGGLTGAFKYNNAVYAEPTLNSLAESFSVILQAVAECATANAAANDWRLMDVPILPAACRDKMIKQWNATDYDFYSGGQTNESGLPCYHPNDTLLSAFERQTEKTPGAIALIFENEPLSYQQFNRRANQLAHFLQAQGVGQGTPVGILLERSLDMVIALYGVIKAGGFYIPLDTGHPLDRWLDIIDQAQLSHVLSHHTTSVTLKTAARDHLQIFDLDLLQNSLAAQPDDNPAAMARPDDLAYAIFTSGSTGKPKGVMISHRAICNRLYWMQQAYQLTLQDHVLQKTPYSFDVSVWEFFWPLMTGARLVIAKPEGHKDPNYLISLIQQTQISVLHFVPSMLALFLAAPEVAKCRSLRRVFCSGEALPFDLQQQFYRVFTDNGGNPAVPELHNLYGPTEAAVDVSYWPCINTFKKTHPHADQFQLESQRQIVPIGFPIANMALYILDGNYNPVPIGAIGELYIGGVGLARGYLGRPDLTAERFIPDPFSDRPGARLYWTGDIARYLPNGAIEYLGRSDDQAKVHGFRIELGEIETLLRQHPQVAQCAVIVRPSPSGENQLAAYVVATEKVATGKVATEEVATQTTDVSLCDSLRDLLKAKLPAYMVPPSFTLLPALPLTVSGKLDRRALPDPEFIVTQAHYAPPCNSVQTQLCALWAKLLKQEQVGIHDNFFELGGDSIIGMQMVLQANQQGIGIDAQLFYQYQTIAELSARAAQAASTRQFAAEDRVGEVMPLPIQEWFFATYVGSHPQALSHFNQSVFVVLPAQLDIDKLRQCLKRLVQRHDCLRMQVEFVDGAWRLEIPPFDPQLADPLTVVDLSENRTEDAASLQQRIEAIAQQSQAALSFQPIEQRPGLFKAVYFNLGDQPGRLLLIAHHLVVDGVSWRILLADLQALYSNTDEAADAANAVDLAMDSNLSALPYRVWTQAMHDHALQIEITDEYEFWSEQLEDALGLPVDFDNETEHQPTESNAAMAQASLSQATTKALITEANQAYHTNPLDLLLTALLRTITLWCEDRQLLVDLEGHGRESMINGLDPSASVGWFTTLYPVCLRFGEAGDDIGEQIKHIKEQLRRIPRQGFNFGLLKQRLKQLNETEKLAQLEVQPEVRFNYLGQFDQLIDGDWYLATAPEDRGAEKHGELPLPYLFDINVLIHEGCLKILWQYSQTEFSAATVNDLVETMRQELEMIVQYCVKRERRIFTASDFPEAQIDNRQLERLMGKIGV